MAKGLAVYNSGTIVHKLLDNGTVSFSGSVAITGNLSPNGNGITELGSPSARWKDVYALQTTVGAIFEYGLSTPTIADCVDGTVLVWGENGLEPCSKEEDTLVMGVAKDNKSEPVVFGAELVLVTGDVKRGDLLCTSNIPGHAKVVKKTRWGFRRDLTGIVIGQALEDATGISNLVKCMISKR